MCGKVHPHNRVWCNYSRVQCLEWQFSKSPLYLEHGWVITVSYRNPWLSSHTCLSNNLCWLFDMFDYKFKVIPCMDICLNGAPVPVETSCRYLRHIIANDVNDSEDIRRQLRCFFMEGLTCCYVPSELVHIQWNCFFFVYVLLWKSVHLQHLV